MVVFLEINLAMYKSLKMIILFDDHIAFGGRYSNEIIKIIPLRGKEGTNAIFYK